jgi:hypothetical protein
VYCCRRSSYKEGNLASITLVLLRRRSSYKERNLASITLVLLHRICVHVLSQDLNVQRHTSWSYHVFSELSLGEIVLLILMALLLKFLLINCNYNKYITDEVFHIEITKGYKQYIVKIQNPLINCTI